MGIDYRIKGRINNLIDKYKKVAIYGTGNGTERLWEYFVSLCFTENIIAIIDRDESPMLGQQLHGYNIKRLDEVAEQIDALVIGSEVYWQVIEERVKLIFQKMGIERPIISLYDFTSKRVRKNYIEDYQKYVEYIENRQICKEENFVPMSLVPYFPKKTDVKVIAWYLPQYYQMEVNDIYHGKGFTEWTNSSQAIPLFVGHEQPHIPYDVGYYDLNNIDTMKRQIELAKWYGISGFCFHYYWFSGKRMMEKPINMFLEHKELDIPFCLNWATENWTSVWDGGKYDVIFEQKIEKDDDKRFMNEILPFFKDSRYIKIDGKPLLIIYTVLMFSIEKCKELLDSFRHIAKENGFPDLYILISNYNDFDDDVVLYGADGLVEFPPTYMGEICPDYEIEGYLNPYFAGKIYDLAQFLTEKKHLQKYKNKKIFRSALVSFDNTARKAKWGGSVFFGASPHTYKLWLSDIIKENKELHEKNENIIFVNSWNEWAEGSHLEPDIRYGYAYLQATCDALYENQELDKEYISNKIRAIKKKGKNPDFYILCIESMGDVVACEPIARFLKNKFPKSKITWIVKKQYREIVQYNPFIDRIKEVLCLSEAAEWCESIKLQPQNIILDCHYNGRVCTVTGQVHINNINPQVNERTYFNFGTLLEHFCLVAGLEPISEGPLFHEKEGMKNLFEQNRYVVIHCKSAEECKDWQYEKWKNLVKKILDKGYMVIEIGLASVLNIQYSNYIDYTGERDLQVIAQLIKGAHSFIGVDSGFAHIANCYKKNSIILLGDYKNFFRPMPYTGYFYKNQEQMLLYASKGTVKNITVEEAFQRWKNFI